MKKYSGKRLEKRFFRSLRDTGNMSEKIKPIFSLPSVADPGCLSRIPDPVFCPFRISDPGSNNNNTTKERGEKI
jgi:hypothetical protein